MKSDDSQVYTRWPFKKGGWRGITKEEVTVRLDAMGRETPAAFNELLGQSHLESGGNISELDNIANSSNCVAASFEEEHRYLWDDGAAWPAIKKQARNSDALKLAAIFEVMGADAPRFCGFDSDLGPIWKRPTLAITGTRRSTPAAEDLMREVGHWLAEEGHVLVHGGARGIDAAASAGVRFDARQKQGGTEVIVPGGGLGWAVGHHPLWAVQAGDMMAAISGGKGPRRIGLSIEPPDREPNAGSLLRRNRVIAALGGVLLAGMAVDAKGGVWETVGWAKRLGRPVAVFEEDFLEERGAFRGLPPVIHEVHRLLLSLADIELGPQWRDQLTEQFSSTTKKKPTTLKTEATSKQTSLF